MAVDSSLHGRLPAADRSTDSLRLPPHSVEAEQSVLGGLMLDNDAWMHVSERLVFQDFYRRDHASIFRAIEALANEGKPYDIVTLSEWFAAQGLLESIGGIDYLAELAENTPTAANIDAWADIVRDRAVLRELIRAGTEIAEAGYRPEGRSTTELIDLAERTVFEIAERVSRGKRGFRRMKELLVGTLDRIDQLFQRDNPITGVATGYFELDGMTSGLQPSDLVIIAGRPSMGKTAFALNIAQHAAIKGDAAVAVFSMEMPAEQLAMRMLSSIGRIDQHKVRTGKLADDDWPRLTHAVGILSEAKLYIDDTPALSPGELRSRCRRLAREHGLGMIVIDYLQLMQVPGNSENRATEISEISRGLKALAKELNVPVLALSQLNRSLEQRSDKRPVMSDLRESGAIEQDADLIMFIYRDEVYNEDSTDKGIAEIIIGKQRNGPIGVRKLRFMGEYTTFENLAFEQYGGEHA
ncbi:MAG: replicative DNA helicase [Gammaproteobacteria bacterium]|nr:replicative DNA helicase [Gammaproteobacteria bacterium]